MKALGKDGLNIDMIAAVLTSAAKVDAINQHELAGSGHLLASRHGFFGENNDLRRAEGLCCQSGEGKGRR